MTDEKIAEAIVLVNRLAMWRKLAKRMPVDSMARWRLSIDFMKTRRELVALLQAEAKK
jgi:hypothetical protein